MELDAGEREGRVGQAEMGEEGGREMSLEGEVVQREQHRQPAARVAQIGAGEPRLPVMRVQRREAALGREPRRRRAERGEADAVVGPVGPVRSEIGVAGAVEQRGRIERGDGEIGRASCRERV